MSELGVALGLAVMLTVAAFGASGLGRLLLGQVCAAGPARTVAAEYLAGWLAGCVVLAAAAQLGVPFPVASWGLAAAALMGVWPALRHADAAQRRMRLTSALAIGVSFLVVSATPVNPNALDPTTYAYMTSVLFHDPWVGSQLPALSDGAWLVGTAHEGVVSRAASLALLWPAAATGWGVDARLVAVVAAWLLVPAFAALLDLLPRRLPLAVRALLAAGALGAYNEIAVLVDAQVNQTFALAAALGAVWAWRWLASARARLVLLALVGAAVAAGYPEFLAALPLYAVCCALQRPVRWTELLAGAAALGAGWLGIQLSSRLDNARFLFEEAAAGPEWWPLPRDPANLGEVWLDVLLQRVPPAPVLVLLVPAAWYVWRRRAWSTCQPRVSSARLATLAAVCVVVLGVVWSWLVVQSPNINYATFKAGSWLGPGLFVAAFALSDVLRPLQRRAVVTLLVVVAALRVLGLLVDAPPKILLYATSAVAADAPPPALVHRPGDCSVIVSPLERRAAMALVAASAAPTRGCATQ